MAPEQQEDIAKRSVAKTRSRQPRRSSFLGQQDENGATTTSAPKERLSRSKSGRRLRRRSDLGSSNHSCKSMNTSSKSLNNSSKSLNTSSKSLNNSSKSLNTSSKSLNTSSKSLMKRSPSHVSLEKDNTDDDDDSIASTISTGPLSEEMDATMTSASSEEMSLADAETAATSATSLLGFFAAERPRVERKISGDDMIDAMERMRESFVKQKRRNSQQGNMSKRNSLTSRRHSLTTYSRDPLSSKSSHN